MKDWARRIGVVFFIVFVFSLLGCLSDVEETTEGPVEVVEQGNNGKVVPEIPGEPQPNVNAYDPNSNKKPLVTYLGTDDLDVPEADKGQVVQLKATAFDPEGSDVKIEYSASGGKITDDGKWTAPQEAGTFNLKAVAVDEAGIKSDPVVMSIKVNNPAGKDRIQLRAPVVQVIDDSKGAPKRAISITDASTAQQYYILTTSSGSNTSTITIVVADTENDHVVSTNFASGSIVLDSTEASPGSYTYRYTFTAPSTAPTGNSLDVVFTVIDPDDATDSDSTTITFIINTKPTLSSSNIALTVTGGTSTNTLAPSGTGTITVTATESDSGDTLTYNYSLLSGSGTLGETTNATGTVDFTAAASAGTTVLLVQVVDTRGGTAEATKTIYVATPMTVLVADSGVAGADAAAQYTEATGSNSADYDITTDVKTGTGGTTAEWSIPVSNGKQTMNAQFGNNPDYYYTGAPSTTHTIDWEVYSSVSSTQEIKGPTNLSISSDNTASNADFLFDGSANQQDGSAATYDFLLKGGMKTLKVNVTASNQVVYDTDTIYVNEFPYISSVTYTGTDGTSASLFDGTTLTKPQVSPGQLFYINLSVNDDDNTRVNPGSDTTAFPTTTTTGFFINKNYNSEAAAGLEISYDIDFTNTSYPATTLDLNTSNSTDLYDPTVNTSPSYYTYTDDYSTTISSIPLEIKPSASADSSTYHYVLFHVADGMGVGHDHDADGDVESYKVPFEILLNDETDTDTDRLIDIATVAYATSYTKNLMIEFYDDSGTVKAKIKDVDTSTYWTDAEGDTITITPVAAVDDNLDGEIADDGGTEVNGTDWVDLQDGVATTTFTEGTDWLMLDIAGAEWDAGDKVYFKTYANTVLAQFEVVNGPKISSISYPSYVTTSDTVTITAYGDANSTTSPAVTMVESTTSGGTLAAGTDGDGDTITGEVYTYTAPATLTTSTVTLLVSISGTSGTNTYTSSREITFTLNNPPTISGIAASSEIDTTNGYWALQGTNPITLISSVTDSDSGDGFSYNWTISSDKYGTLRYANTSSVDWTPYNNGTALTDDDGPYTNGQFPVQLTVLDKDSNGVFKGGIDTTSINVGINSAPVYTEVIQGVKAAATYNGALAEQDTGRVAVDWATDQYKGTSFTYFVGPTLTDAADDRDSLNFDWYITLDSPTGPIASSIGALEVISSTYNTADATVTNISGQMLKWTPTIDTRGNNRTYFIHARVSDDKAGVAKGILDSTFAVAFDVDDSAPTVEDADGSIVEVLDAGVDNTYGVGDIIRFKISQGDGIRDMAGGSIGIGELLNTTENAAASYFEQSGGFQYSYGATIASPTGDTLSDYSDDFLYYDYEVVATINPELDYTDEAAWTADLAVSLYDWSGNIADNIDVDFGAITIDNQPPLGETSLSVLQDRDIVPLLSEASNSTGAMRGYTKNNDMITLNDGLSFTVDIYNNLAVDDNDVDVLIGSVYAPQLGIMGSGFLPGYRPTTTAATDWMKFSFSFSGGNYNGGRGWTDALTELEREYSEILAGEVLTSSQGYTGLNTGTFNVDFYVEDNAGNQVYIQRNILDVDGDTSDEADAIDGIDLKKPALLSAEVYSFLKTATTDQAGWAPVVHSSLSGPAGEITLTNGYGRDAAAANDITINGEDSDGYKFAWLDVSAGTLDDGSTTTAEIIKLTFDEPLYTHEGNATDTTIDYAVPTITSVHANATDGNVVTSVNDTSIKIYKVDGAVRKEVSSITPNATYRATVTAGDVTELSKIKNYAVRYIDANGSQAWTAATAVRTEVYIALFDDAATNENLDDYYLGQTGDPTGHYAVGTHFEVEFNDFTADADIATEKVMDGNTNYINAARESLIGDDAITWEQ